MCSSLREQEEQLLLTGNLWGPTAGLGWLGTGSNGTVRKTPLVTLGFTPNPPGEERITWNAHHVLNTHDTLGLHLSKGCVCALIQFHKGTGERTFVLSAQSHKQTLPFQWRILT